jgi:hypothetical protein
MEDIGGGISPIPLSLIFEGDLSALCVWEGVFFFFLDCFFPFAKQAWRLFLILLIERGFRG